MLLLELDIGVNKYPLWYLISRSWEILLSRNGLPGRQLRISDQVLVGKGLLTQKKKAPAITGIMAGAGTSANWGITEAYCRNIVLPYVRHKVW